MAITIKEANDLAEAISAYATVRGINNSSSAPRENPLKNAGDHASLVNYFSSPLGEVGKRIIGSATTPAILASSIYKISNGTAEADNYSDILSLLGVALSSATLESLAISFSAGYKGGKLINEFWGDEIDRHAGAYAEEVGNFYSDLTGSAHFGAIMSGITRSLGAIELGFEKGLDVVGVHAMVDKAVRWATDPDYLKDANNAQASSLLNNERDMQRLYQEGLISKAFYNDFTKWSADALRKSADNLLNTLPPNFGSSGVPVRFPIGAFYDSSTLVSDTAQSIADKTLVLLDNHQKGVSAAQFSALDTNQDGQLSGDELGTLSAWADLNENGEIEQGEVASLPQRAITLIGAVEFARLTRGNSRQAASAGAVREDFVRVAPVSDFRTLRDTDNRFFTQAGVIEWRADQVKINYGAEHMLVGTDGDDSFAFNTLQGQGVFDVYRLTHFLGGGGNDAVGGSLHDDNIWGGTGNDKLYGYAGNDSLFGEEGDDGLLGGDGNDYLDGGQGNDKLFGDAGNDILVGGEGDDWLSAGVGNDHLYGQAGADVLLGDSGDDYLDGGSEDDRLSGGIGADVLFGGTGNDRLEGGAGNDVLSGENGNDVLFGDDGDDQLYGGSGVDELQGGAGQDLMCGESGNDRLFGQVGDDVLYGGDGDDLLVGFTAANDYKQTLDTGETDNDWLYGGAGNDVLVGGFGNDYLDGGAGADVMEGGQGDDTYVVNSSNDVILELRNEGYDRVISSTSYLLNAQVEELRLLEGFDSHGTGNALDNLLIGNSRDNILDGVTGADRMIGGAGNDTYFVDNAGDLTVELANEGIDTVQASISHTLADNLENLVLLDFAKAEKGLIDGRPSLIYGFPKANELDYMQGDANPDYRGTCALTSIANLLTQTDRPTSEGDVLQVAIDNRWLNPIAFTPSTRGGTRVEHQQAILNNYGLRNDLLSGYSETATANLLRSGRGVIQAVNAGALWDVQSKVGDGGVNHMVTITGVAYAETTGELLGFYIADSGRKLVSDMTRFVGIELFRQAANVAGTYAIYTIEPLKLWDEDINATGNSQDNLLVGNRGDNVLTGGAGNDTLEGQGGNDVLDGGAGDDTLVGGAGNDTYLFGRGYGHDTVKTDALAASEAEYVRFLEAVGPDNLWFSRNGRHLDVSIIGTQDRLTVNDWFTDPSKQNLTFETFEGEALIASQVNRLVDAMAAFAPPSSGSSVSQPNYKEALEAVIATGWS